MGRSAIGIGEEITNGREGSFMRQNLGIVKKVNHSGRERDGQRKGSSSVSINPLVKSLSFPWKVNAFGMGKEREANSL